jgi:AbrB family looped-hinge helix DNA binding protein
MPSTVLTTKGQITIPAEIRKELGLRTGDRVHFVRNPETGRYEMTKKTGSIMDLMGMVKYSGPPVTVDEMGEAVAAHVAEDDERIKREYRDLRGDR